MTQISPTSPKIHALVIGINKYAHKKHKDLKGCVPDAMAFMDYLTQDLGVPQDQIMCLLDKQATRKSILDAFQSHLINNVNIKHSDPIVVYFAGHAIRVSAPPEWHSSDGMCGLILPYDASWSDIREDIINDIPPSERQAFVHGIPNRMLRSLTYRLHELKGDNITIILDSSFSGSDMGTAATNHYSALERSNDMKQQGMFVPVNCTHTLLAACPSDKTCQEISVTDPATGKITQMGLFTFHLLQALRTCNLSTTSYSGLMYRVAHSMNNYAAQHRRQVNLQAPQCEGVNQDRVPFQTRLSPTKGMLRILPRDVRGEFIAKAGNATGVTVGTVFDVYPADMAPGSDPVAHLVATQVRSTEAILSATEQGQVVEIPCEAYARVSKFNGYSNGVRILVVDRPRFDPVWEDVFGNLHSLATHVIWTQPDEPSDLIVKPTETGASLQLSVPSAQSATRLLMNEDGIAALTEILADILVGITRFHFHLHHQNPDHPLRDRVGMQLFDLEVSSSSFPFELPIYGPKADAVDLFEQSLATGSTVELQENPAKRYGLMLTNNSGKDLFPYVFYYSLQDYSITCLYSPPSRAPLTSWFCGVPGFPGIGGLPIGYGSHGSPIHMSVPNGYTRATGYLKLTVSTQWLDYESLPQNNSFGGIGRSGFGNTPMDMETWDTVVVSMCLLK
ncbi:hypothetical protein BDV93DRAFT_570816 [Ceratobasidium sp. AG-I]|nr:hypothetical protein BDV93DRAFT_570816 [Ceratobasidium sp. AG-I]